MTFWRFWLGLIVLVIFGLPVANGQEKTKKLLTKTEREINVLFDSQAINWPMGRDRVEKVSFDPEWVTIITPQDYEASIDLSSQ